MNRSGSPATIARQIRESFPVFFKGVSVKTAVIALLIPWFLASCTGLRRLEEDQLLYTGHRINIESEEPIPNRSRVESELAEVVRPEPNSQILISRPRLWIYNLMGDTGESGIDHWIQTNLGRPPVLFEEVDIDRVIRLMQNRLFNIGHFDAGVEYEVREQPQRRSVDYNVFLRPPFRIRNIIGVQEDIPVAGDINLSMEETILESGNIYRLEDLRNERERIDRFLKERGYFYFHPDYLIFVADSTPANRVVDLYLRIKPTAPAIALEKFRIRDVYINAGHPEARLFAGQPSPDETPAPPLEIREGVYLVTGADIFRPDALRRAIFLERDQVYRNIDRRRTISYLMGMEVFKFVNVTFQQAAINRQGNNYLDARVTLLPMDRKAITGELSGVSKDNDFAGPRFTGTWTHRNLFGGAERLRVSLEGAFETLLGVQGINSIEAGISTELRIPRLIPFEFAWISPELIPSTRMMMSFNYLNRTDAFTLGSFRSEYGYVWSPSIRTRQRFTPLLLNIFGLGTIAPEYEELFSRDMLLRRGLFEQFILGSDYSYMYNSQLDGMDNRDWYFNANFEAAGNMLWLASDYLGLGSVDQEGNYRIFGQSFSQFFRSEFDFRYYQSIGSNTRLATRIITGLGVPYGNAETLPYTRLFVIGGTNSIRAFHPRSLGPGAYSPPDELISTFNIFQAGEIKLEMNLEFRYALGNIVKTAIFADAGNIWNLREIEDVPGGRFEYPGFIRQIALGTGAGLRLDFTFFLLRLDLAFPLADPRAPGNGYFQPVRPLDPQWRRDNLVFNLAIGYPF